ncbi:5'-methylthioadenosine/S-adenosylhomocysteine nucleosidase [Chromobacterium haemolyticum]|uniref:5'-methylthioadenosine/S-adenosylhomocysteine nucleosidase n=1 Tax=Chromobacterium haemolyticum TaxID=394935 RepID=UPI00307CD79D
MKSFKVQLVSALLALSAAVHAAPVLDATTRTAVVSAFGPEETLLLSQASDKREYRVNGVRFTTAQLEGQPVLLFMSGVSMGNAAMNTQLALDRFNVSRIVFSGIAGGVDDRLRIGDVAVPRRWGNYAEAIYARETAPGRYAPPPYADPAARANYGMIHPRDVKLATADGGSETRFWFEVDPELLRLAKDLPADILRGCDAAKRCLSAPPRIVAGGNGLSGPIFMDNAGYRDYLAKTYQAQVVDMETVAVAQVAHANRVPFIAFRSLSDLAGGSEHANEMDTFMQIAADNAANTVRALLRALKH